MKTPITYYGGKQSMVKYILPKIPPHRVYCEPFFGGGAIFFGKVPSPVEIINDTNGEVVNFYRVMQKHFKQLQSEIHCTLHSRHQHHHARIIYDNPELFDPIKRAWAFWTLASQSFSGNLKGGWGFDLKSKGLSKRLSNKKTSFLDDYAKRLEGVQIECKDAIKVIEHRDSPDTFFYCDPPYFNANMGHYGGYTERDFEALLQALSSIQGKFLLSSYPSPVLDRFVNEYGWKQEKIEKSIRVTGTKSKWKTEVLTRNG